MLVSKKRHNKVVAELKEVTEVNGLDKYIKEKKRDAKGNIKLEKAVKAFKNLMKKYDFKITVTTDHDEAGVYEIDIEVVHEDTIFYEDIKYLCE